jgi:uroporphyrin-3 C-methyltransferase
VSETVLPKENLEPRLEAPAPTSTEPSKRRGNSLVILALLLGAAGVAAGGWGVWQVRILLAGHQQQSGQLQDIGAQTQTLKENELQLATRLAQLPAADELENRRQLVAQLQGDQQRLSQRLETVLGASRKDWRLAEAEHLIRLASLRLSALQDINSAQSLVQGADEILREQSDPGSYAAREQLAKSLAALRSVEQPDRTGLYLQLAALRDQVVQLAAIAPEYQLTEPASQGRPSSDTDNRLSQWWEQISRYFRIDFNPDDNIRPLLAGQGLNQVRLALSLALEQAQWAALNGESAVYSRSLGEARSVLQDNFNQDNPQSKAMLARIAELEPKAVSVATPDLAASLSAVQAYLERRHLSADEAKASAGTPATQE